MRHFFVFVFVVLSLCFDTASHAANETEIQAASIISDKIAGWVAGLDNRPPVIGVFQVRISTPLTPEYATLLESEVVRKLKQRNDIKVVSCMECRAPNVKIDGDKLVLSKGAPDLETLKRLGKSSGAEGFLVLDVMRTNYTIMAEATLYKTATGEILGIEQVKIPAFEMANKSMLLMFQGGTGRIIGPRDRAIEESTPLSLVAAVFEELGFGKGGLTLGSIFGGNYGKMGYLLPTIAFRGQFGATPVYSLSGIGAGFGVAGSTAGLTLRGSYDVFIGSLTFAGLEGVYLIPLNGILEDNTPAMRGYIGFHIGFSFGI